MRTCYSYRHTVATVVVCCCVLSWKTTAQSTIDRNSLTNIRNVNTWFSFANCLDLRENRKSPVIVVDDIRQSTTFLLDRTSFCCIYLSSIAFNISLFLNSLSWKEVREKTRTHTHTQLRSLLPIATVRAQHTHPSFTDGVRMPHNEKQDYALCVYVSVSYCAWCVQPVAHQFTVIWSMCWLRVLNTHRTQAHSRSK